MVGAGPPPAGGGGVEVEEEHRNTRPAKYSLAVELQIYILSTATYPDRLVRRTRVELFFELVAT